MKAWEMFVCLIFVFLSKCFVLLRDRIFKSTVTVVRRMCHGVTEWDCIEIVL